MENEKEDDIWKAWARRRVEGERGRDWKRVRLEVRACVLYVYRARHVRVTSITTVQKNIIFLCDSQRGRDESWS